MNVGLLVNVGNRLVSPVNVVPRALPEMADISHITQQDTLVLQVIDPDYQLLLEAQSVAAKSQGHYKAGAF